MKKRMKKKKKEKSREIVWCSPSFFFFLKGKSNNDFCIGSDAFILNLKMSVTRYQKLGIQRKIQNQLKWIENLDKSEYIKEIDSLEWQRTAVIWKKMNYLCLWFKIDSIVLYENYCKLFAFNWTKIGPTRFPLYF